MRYETNLTGFWGPIVMTYMRRVVDFGWMLLRDSSRRTSPVLYTPDRRVRFTDGLWDLKEYIIIYLRVWTKYINK